MFEEFPDRLLDLEIKDGPDAFATADGLAALIGEYDATDQVVVVSFSDAILERFRAAAPDVDTSPGQDTIIAWFGARGPLPGETSLQVPPTFSGITVVTEQFVTDAHANDLAVYVWFNGNSDDTTASYEALLDMGVDGFITGKPALLQETLDARGPFATPLVDGPRSDRIRPRHGRVDLTCPQRTASRCAGTVLVVAWNPGSAVPVLLADAGAIDLARGDSVQLRLRPTEAGAEWVRSNRGGEALVVVVPSNSDTGLTVFTIPVGSS